MCLPAMYAFDARYSFGSFIFVLSFSHLPSPFSVCLSIKKIIKITNTERKKAEQKSKPKTNGERIFILYAISSGFMGALESEIYCNVSF